MSLDDFPRQVRQAVLISGTVYVSIPKRWATDLGIGRGSYVVLRLRRDQVIEVERLTTVTGQGAGASGSTSTIGADATKSSPHRAA